MGQDKSNENKKEIEENELLCNKCYEYPLFELLVNENNIKVRKYCFCGESTSIINNIKIYITYNKYSKLIIYYINPQTITNFPLENCNYYKENIKYCLECNKLFILQDNHVHIILFLKKNITNYEYIIINLIWQNLKI